MAACGLTMGLVCVIPSCLVGGSEGWEVGGYLWAHNGTGMCNTILPSGRE